MCIKRKAARFTTGCLKICFPKRIPSLCVYGLGTVHWPHYRFFCHTGACAPLVLLVRVHQLGSLRLLTTYALWLALLPGFRLPVVRTAFAFRALSLAVFQYPSICVALGFACGLLLRWWHSRLFVAVAGLEPALRISENNY